LKTIGKYLKEFWKNDYNRNFYIYSVLFVAICTFLNYKFDLKTSVLDADKRNNFNLLGYTLFYAVAYYGIAVPRMFITGDKTELKNYGFWAKSFLFVFLTALVSAFNFQYKIIESFESMYERQYMNYIFFYLKRPAVLLIPLIILKLTIDFKTHGLYGLHLRNLNLKPYFTLLAFMIPLIIAASFMPDFLRTYPKFKSWTLSEQVFELPNWLAGLFFELTYGIDFVFVELLFRGMFVIGLASLVDRKAVMPAAATYVFLHFGKPVGEAISSFFGGYILGVIALYTRTIFGGVIIHLGIAYSMEITAYLQHAFKMNNS